MHYIDILIIIPLLWGAYKGFTKGLITEIASLLSLILGIYGAIKLSNYTSSFLIKTFDFTSEYLPVISFAITFIIIVILVHLISKLIDSMIKTASLGVVNRILGAVFGTAKFLLILGVVIILLNLNKDYSIFSINTEGINFQTFRFKNFCMKGRVARICRKYFYLFGKLLDKTMCS